MTRHGHRIATLAGLLALAAAGCKLDLDTAPPRVGPPAGTAPPPAGLVVELVEAGVQDGHVWLGSGASTIELRPVLRCGAGG